MLFNLFIDSAGICIAGLLFLFVGWALDKLLVRYANWKQFGNRMTKEQWIEHGRHGGRRWDLDHLSEEERIEILKQEELEWQLNQTPTTTNK